MVPHMMRRRTLCQSDLVVTGKMSMILLSHMVSLLLGVLYNLGQACSANLYFTVAVLEQLVSVALSLVEETHSTLHLM